VPARNPFGEPNISDFEILYATLVDAETIFAGEIGLIAAQSSSTDVVAISYSFALVAFDTAWFLSLSVNGCAVGLLGTGASALSRTYPPLLTRTDPGILS
jgi:hypothetical protein